MNGHKIGTIANIAWMECKYFFRSTKLILLGMFLIFVNVQVILPLKDCAVAMNEKLSFGEAFTALGNSGIVVLIFPLFFLAIMADFPRKDGIYLYYQIRCGRMTWVLGQLVFALLSSIFLTIFSLIASGMLLMPYVRWSVHFSHAITNYVSTYPERSGEYVVQLLPENLYNQMTLGTALLHTLFLLILYFFLLALVLLFFALLNHKLSGILMDGIIITAGAISCASRTRYMWFLPMSHTITWLHYTEYFCKEVFPMVGSYLYFIMINLCLILFCIFASKRYQIL